MPRIAMHSRRRSPSCSVIALATVLAVGATPAAAQSFNGSGQFVSGTGSIATPDALTTNISITSPQAVINWTPDDNATGTTANILFQDAGSTATFSSTANFAVLNNIDSASTARAIEMNGTVRARVGGLQRGSVYFYAPGGFVFGGGSSFNVGSLVVSALPIAWDANGFITNFGTSNTVTFGQALNPNAAIVSGGSINANVVTSGVPSSSNSSYVALVAPRVAHSGSIIVNGSAALVGAEAATISFSSDGLFDIQVTTGTDDPNGVVVSGDIGGPAANAVDNQHRVYLVAVPKNDALTMVISNGADLGFTLAGNASVDQYGAVILSAGHDIENGVIGGESAASNAPANFWFTGAHATNNLFGEATGYADLYSTDAQASQMVTVFDSDVTVHADEHVAMGASGAGSSLTVSGNLSLSTDAIAGFSGGSAQGGDTSLYAWDSASVTVTGDTLLTANGFGGSTESSGEAGGTGTGGKVVLQSDPGGTLHVIGDVELQADGFGGDSFDGNGGAGIGGAQTNGGGVTVSAQGGTLTLDKSLTVSASGFGGGAFQSGTTSGAGTGGDVVISAGANGDFSVAGNSQIDAEGHGGDVGFQVSAGSGTGGRIDVSATGTNALLDFTGDLVLSADGFGGFGIGDCTDCGGLGGDGFGGGDDNGGGIFVSASGAGASLTVGGDFDATSDGHGSTGLDADGGFGKGGKVQLYAADSGLIDITGDVELGADGEGGSRQDNGNGGGLEAFAGDGQGGFVELFTFGTGTPDIDLLGAVELHAEGFGGDNFVEGVAAFGGSGLGGTAWLDAQSGTIDITGNTIVTATGHGGEAAAGTGGDGTGKNAEIDGIGGTVTIGGTALVDVSGTGGDGLVGGNGTGGGEIFNDGTSIDGAHIFASNGTVSITGAATVSSDGIGGDGVNGAFEAAGGDGGDGTGGFAAVTAFNNDLGPSNITLSTLTASASATGGAGGTGGGGSQGGNGGAGGDALGGQANVLAFAGNGHLTVGTANVLTTATGGAGGDAGNSDGQAGGSGGAGGNAEGGFSEVGTASGITATASNLGTATFGTIVADSSGTGGDGGAGSFGTPDGDGGDGGVGDGGRSTLLVRGSQVTVNGTTTLVSNGTGGDGGFGGGDLGTQGAGGNGFAGELSVTATSRYQHPEQTGTLTTGAIIGTAAGTGGLGSTNGDGIVEGGSSFLIDRSTVHIASLDFDITGDAVDPGADESFVRITNSTVRVDDTFAFSTIGDLSFYIDNGSLGTALNRVGSINLSAADFVADTVLDAPTNVGTAFATNLSVTSGGDFIADANLNVTNGIDITVPGSIRFDNATSSSFVDLWAQGGSIDIGNANSGSSTSLVADSFITGGNITAGGSIFAQSGEGDINLGSLTSTFSSIFIDAGGDVDLGGDAQADGSIEVAATGDILMQDALAGENVDLDAGGSVTALNLTAGDSVLVEAGGAVDVAVVSAGLVDPSTNEGAEHLVRIVSGTSIETGDISSLTHIGLATPGTIDTGDIDADGIFMALAHGDMHIGDTVAGEVFLSDYAVLNFGGLTATCIGECGSLGADGDVTAPPSGPTYAYVTTNGGEDGAGQLAGEGGTVGEPTNGSLFTTSEFEVAAGEALDFWFNYVTSDGAGFADYAWAGLYTANLDPVAILFTARTQEVGTIVPGFNLPGVEATLDPASVPIIGGTEGPAWSPLGGSSGSCFDAGCGFTGWVSSSYEIADAGSYVLRFGVTNWNDQGFDSGMAFSGLTVGGVSLTPTLLTRTGGSITIGDVETGKFSAAAGTSLTTGIIDSGGSITLDAGAAILTEDLFAGNFVLGNGGSITTQNIEAGSVDMTSTGGNITTLDIDAVGAVALDAFGNIQTGDITAGSIDLFAGGNITTDNLTTQQLVLLGDGITIQELQPGASITLEAGGDISTDNISSIDGVFALAGGNITTLAIDAVDFVSLDAGGNINTGAITAGDQISAEANGNITTGLLDAGLDIDFENGGNVIIAGATAGTDIEIESDGSVTANGNILAGNEVSVESGGAVSLMNVTAGTSLDDDFSVGIAAVGNINVGNVSGAGPVGFATTGNLTTGNLTAGELVMALVGGNIVTGSITTNAEGGGQVYLADDSMFFAAGGTVDGADEFEVSSVLAEDPVMTGGSITINGPVNTGLFQAAAGTGLTAQAITADAIESRAGGTATINGLWSAPDVRLASNNIDITQTGGIAAGAEGEVNLLSSNGATMLIGDGLSGSGYALSNAEFGRISGGNINIIAGAFAGATANTLIGDLTITAGPTGNIRSAEGGLAIIGLSESGLERDGAMRVVGDVVGTGFTNTNYLAFATEHFELDAAAGSIALSAPGGGLGGELDLFADTIHVADLQTLFKLAANPTYTNYQNDLNKTATVQRPEGVIRVDTLWIESENLSSVLIQNTGSGFQGGTPAGFVVRQAFINDDMEVAGPPGSINLVVNGQVVTEGGTLTGVEARDALVGESADITPFTSNSTINGCPLTGACIIAPPPPPPTVDIVDNFIDLLGDDPLGESEFGNEDDIADNEEGDQGANNPISPPQPLFDSRPLIPSGDVNDPVSGTGNPALLGSDQQCEEEEQGQCPANPVNGDSQ